MFARVYDGAVKFGPVDQDDPRRPSMQVADELRQAIRSGKLTPGERLPAIADLSAAYGIARNTVASALSKLQDENLVVIRQGSGAYVRSKIDIGDDDHDDPVMAELLMIREQLRVIAERLDAVERVVDLP
jgi:DNA-binding GntR family transcriptional regulator